MDVLIVSLVVIIILSCSYVFFGKEIDKQKRLKSVQLKQFRDFYQIEMQRINHLKLEGVETDGNSDFEFKQAVNKIKLPQNVRIQLYD